MLHSQDLMYVLETWFIIRMQIMYVCMFVIVGTALLYTNIEV